MSEREIATIMTILTTGLGAYATNVLVSLFTMSFPERPTWAGPAAALALGITCEFLQTLAFTAEGLTLQTVPQAILGGILIGGAAMGLHSAHVSAEAKRGDAQLVTWERTREKVEAEEAQAEVEAAMIEAEPAKRRRR